MKCVAEYKYSHYVNTSMSQSVHQRLEPQTLTRLKVWTTSVTTNAYTISSVPTILTSPGVAGIASLPGVSSFMGEYYCSCTARGFCSHVLAKVPLKVAIFMDRDAFLEQQYYLGFFLDN